MISIQINETDRKIAHQIAIERQKSDRANHKHDKRYSKDRTSLETTEIGAIAEIVFFRAFDVKTIGSWVIYDNVKFGTDFRNHLGDSIELKSSDRVNGHVKVNVDYYRRKLRDRKLARYFVFVKFDGNFKIAKTLTVLGYMPSAMIIEYAINPDKKDISPAYRLSIDRLFFDVGKILKLRRPPKK